MSCTISISNAKEDIWIIRNAIFRWFNRIAHEHFPNDADVIDCMQKAEYFEGISLDLVQSENPNLAVRLDKILLTVAREVAEGKYALSDDQGNPWPEMQCQESFANLCVLLEKRASRTNFP